MMNLQPQLQPGEDPWEWNILIDLDNNEVFIYHPSYQSPSSELVSRQKMSSIRSNLFMWEEIRREGKSPARYQLTRSRFNNWQDVFSIIDDTIPPGREHDSLIRRLIHDAHVCEEYEAYKEYCFNAVTGNKEGVVDVI